MGEECHPALGINNLQRKETYKKFWTMLFHHGVFLDERHQPIKQAALKRDPRCKSMVWHRRDILMNRENVVSKHAIHGTYVGMISKLIASIS